MSDNQSPYSLKKDASDKGEFLASPKANFNQNKFSTTAASTDKKLYKKSSLGQY